MQFPICTINFINMSRSGWTWHNLWNFLTINFKYKYFHKFGQGCIFKCISLHDWKNENRLLKNAFVKLRPPPPPLAWSDHVESHVIPHVEQPPNKLPPICDEKLLEKGPSILYNMGTLCPCPTGKSSGGMCSLNICKECRLRLVNILNLAKKDFMAE